MIIAVDFLDYFKASLFQLLKKLEIHCDDHYHFHMHPQFIYESFHTVTLHQMKLTFAVSAPFLSLRRISNCFVIILIKARLKRFLVPRLPCVYALFM